MSISTKAVLVHTVLGLTLALISFIFGLYVGTVGYQPEPEPCTNQPKTHFVPQGEVFQSQTYWNV